MIDLLSKRLALFLLGCGLVATLIPVTLWSADDEFIVETQITASGPDVTAPDAPTNLSATAVATSQIDLSWTASTDDVAVTGYQVFRDGLQVATTTATNYSDTGLTAETLYEYYVTAFDAAGNISATSTPVSATTLAEVVEDGGGGGVSGVAFTIIFLEVVPGTHTAVIRWETAGYTRSVVQYGETRSYELGATIEQHFAREHMTVLTGLEPDTQYYFTIDGETAAGHSGNLAESRFRTLPGPDVSAPSNVRNLTAVRDGEDVVLEWENPSDEDFSHVRVLWNGRFYPADIADGALVYQGSQELARDIGRAQPGTVQYYTVFSYDTNGNISSGAVVAVQIDEDGTVVPLDPSEFPDAPDQIDLSLSDLLFFQDGEQLVVTDGMVHIDGSRQLLVHLPYNRVPERLKSIMVTIYRGGENTERFSFLLRVNDDKTAYTATIAPFGTAGIFPFSMVVFDYESRKQANVAGVIAATVDLGSSSSGLLGAFKGNYLALFLSMLGLLLAIAFWLLWRSYTIRRRVPDLVHGNSASTSESQ